MGKGIPKRYLHIVFLKNHLLGFPILRETGHFVQPLPRRSLRERLPATSSSSWRLGINPKLTGKYRKIIYITYIYNIYIIIQYTYVYMNGNHLYIYIGWEDFPATIFQFFTGQFFREFTWVGIGSEKMAGGTNQ